ncbi:hypothetical protein DFQ01_104120 [Paenibacillus cellulosilyticus]|uniref:Uncharacterized protein n=1 Tax=Paenibacillus cellulosilyticus TaxID=375489 RepID=A0A2V2YXF6_9BACL|nr:hypothetical protein [Paenibacillus cellulosilyticus]PWW05560.1 hypothetical protein DFQ01_104120 [Paenibacillus cellulosilyticus]QKS45404.1 hypothetical protein HUB94_13980 [Paenibacillus cellulosilyticus]
MQRGIRLAAASRRFVRRGGAALALLLFMTTATGCLYPKDQLVQNQIPAKDAVLNAQTVINQYFTDTGMLPIVTSGSDTPKYEKYRVDWAKLKSRHYITDPPSQAFEGGGHYYYIIINEETTRQVKLMDIAIYQQVSDIQRWIDDYGNSDSKNELPKKEEAYPGYYRIDFDKLGKKEPELLSIYSGRAISPMIDDSGKVYLDYGLDIAQAVQKSGITPKEGDDVRELLAQSSDLVPVKSPPYQWVDGEPQAQPDTK